MWPEKRAKYSEPESDDRCCEATNLNERFINTVARRIGNDFHEIGISLGYRHDQLEHLEQIYKTRIVKRHHVMILKWRDTAIMSGMGAQHIRNLLSKLIKEAGNTELAEYISSDYGNIEADPRFTTNLQSVIFDIDGDYDQRDRDRRMIEGWRQLDTHYHETRVYEESKRILKDRGCVTIIGPPGDGKTATCRHLALHMESECYDIIPVRKMETLVNCLARKGKQLIILDDPIGRMILDIRKVEEIFSISEEVQNAINEQSMKVVVVVRKSILEECRSDIRRSFLGKNTVDMTSAALQLNEKERYQILEKYGIPHTKLQQVKTNLEKYFPGFPLLCHILSEESENVPLNCQNVKEVLMTQIHDMEMHSRYRYCAMVLTAMANGKFYPNDLLRLREDNDKKRRLEEIIESCGLSLVPETIKQLKESFGTLKHSYLIENDGWFAFVHDFIYDVVIEHYGSKNIPIIIKLTSSSFIRERVRLDNVERVSGFLQIPKEEYYALAVRMSEDIQAGKAYDVFNNPSVSNKEYQLVFAKVLVSSNEILKLLITSMVEDSHMMNKIKMSLDAALLDSSPIHCICRMGCTFLLKTVLEAFSESPETILTSLEGHTSPLHFAAGYGHLETVKYLLSFNVDPNAKSSLRKVDASVGEYYSGFTPLFYAARENHVDVVECLLVNGADPDIVRDHGASPMLLAADKGHSEIIGTLIRHKADTNICCEHGTSPLFLASQENHTDAVKVLLDGGADVNHQKPSNGMTPLMIASRKGNTETVRLLLEEHANQNLVNKDGNTALHLSAASSETLTAKLLLKFNADKSLRNKDDKLPINLAEENGYKEIIALLNERN